MKLYKDLPVKLLLTKPEDTLNASSAAVANMNPTLNWDTKK